MSDGITAQDVKALKTAAKKTASFFFWIDYPNEKAYIRLSVSGRNSLLGNGWQVTYAEPHDGELYMTQEYEVPIAENRMTNYSMSKSGIWEDDNTWERPTTAITHLRAEADSDTVRSTFVPMLRVGDKLSVHFTLGNDSQIDKENKVTTDVMRIGFERTTTAGKKTHRTMLAAQSTFAAGSYNAYSILKKT